MQELTVQCKANMKPKEDTSFELVGDSFDMSD
jgi:hypothetical protein